MQIQPFWLHKSKRCSLIFHLTEILVDKDIVGCFCFQIEKQICLRWAGLDCNGDCWFVSQSPRPK